MHNLKYKVGCAMLAHHRGLDAPWLTRLRLDPGRTREAWNSLRFPRQNAPEINRDLTRILTVGGLPKAARVQLVPATLADHSAT